MRSNRQLGFTLIEMMVVVAIVGTMTAIAIPAFRTMKSDQALRSGARNVGDAFMLARAQAIRTNSNVIVVMQGATGLAVPAPIQTTSVIDIINDGAANTADCAITGTGEVIWTFQGDPTSGLSWGTTLAGTTSVPTDNGFAQSNSDKGSTFTNATVSAATVDNTKFASWVVFQPDGIPRLMTPGSCGSLGAEGQGGGGIYLTNGRRDYAIILSPLGTIRVHQWGGTGWVQ